MENLEWDVVLLKEYIRNLKDQLKEAMKGYKKERWLVEREVEKEPTKRSSNLSQLKLTQVSQEKKDEEEAET